MKTNLHSYDTVVSEYIRQTPYRSYDDILKLDRCWPVFYHLSILRESLLSWYEFRDGASLLEVGGGMGALTGLFCEQCEEVTVVERSAFRADSISRRHEERANLTVIIGDACSVDLGDKKFDYITAIGILDTQQNKPVFLKKLRSLLKPGGKLIIATENRFGIKYWCGAQEKHTNLPFMGIRDSALYFSKKGLKDILAESGFESQKFYYPMPDYILPQLIYSENLLPENDMKTRIIPYYLDSSSLLAFERDIYGDISENGAFEFLANSFLVECGQDDNFCPVIYAAVTTDRPQEYRFVTAVRDDGKVSKIPLHPYGIKTVSCIHKNLDEISKRGVPVVESEIKNGALVMPRYEFKTVEQYLLDRLQKGDLQSVAETLDRIYEYVLKSSDHVSAEQNALYLEYSNIDFGPVLKKAYIDMVPINSFLKDGGFVFFDQEFTRDNFPAKYVMYRALYLTYINAGEKFPLADFKKRYDLDSIWGIFDREEAKFVDSVRSRELYAGFYKWAAVSPYALEYNLQRLSGSNGVASMIKLCIEKGWTKVVIYGYGEPGALLCHELLTRGIAVPYVIDKNADKIKKERYTEVSIVPLQEQLGTHDAIIITVKSEADKIKDMLKELVGCPIVSMF